MGFGKRPALGLNPVSPLVPFRATGTNVLKEALEILRILSRYVGTKRIAMEPLGKSMCGKECRVARRLRARSDSRSKVECEGRVGIRAGNVYQIPRRQGSLWKAGKRFMFANFELAYFVWLPLDRLSRHQPRPTWPKIFAKF